MPAGELQNSAGASAAARCVADTGGEIIGYNRVLTQRLPHFAHIAIPIVFVYWSGSLGRLAAKAGVDPDILDLAVERA